MHKELFQKYHSASQFLTNFTDITLLQCVNVTRKKKCLFRLCYLRKTTGLYRIKWDIVYLIDRITPLLDIPFMGQKKVYSEMFFKVAKQKAVLSYYYSSQ